jgi:DNA polymerase elongation subunit (family B)
LAEEGENDDAIKAYDRDIELDPQDFDAMHTVKIYQKIGLHLSPGMEIGYVVRDAAKWEVDTERDASGFDARYYRKLLEKAWEEVAFALSNQSA